VCKESCNGNGVCLNGTCACFRGYEGETCSGRTYNLHSECSDKCADYCATSCKSTFDTEINGVGKQCFVGCSKKCFTRCLKGSYEVPDTVGRCDTPYCKMMKRTMLDMEGVFSSTSHWVEKAAASGAEPLITQQAAQQLLQDEPVSIAHALPASLNVEDMSRSADLKPEEIEQIMTGKPPASMSSKSLADSVLFDLSDEDRELLEKMNVK
jgi:hypothetical protein